MLQQNLITLGLDYPLQLCRTASLSKMRAVLFFDDNTLTMKCTDPLAQGNNIPQLVCTEVIKQLLGCFMNM